MLPSKVRNCREGLNFHGEFSLTGILSVLLGVVSGQKRECWLVRDLQGVGMSVMSVCEI